MSFLKWPNKLFRAKSEQSSQHFLSKKAITITAGGTGSHSAGWLRYMGLPSAKQQHCGFGRSRYFFHKQKHFF